MSSELPDIMTLEETCNYLRIPRSSLYKLAQEGKIPCQKVGRHWRFRKQALDRWLEAYPQTSSLTKIEILERTGE
jgi:excisionase family DNA binding protein